MARPSAALRRRRPQPARPGFTMLELVIAMAVLVVLVAAATPSISATLARQRLLSVARHLGADLAAARHEALRRGTAVHLVTQPGKAWCYGLALRADADCQLSPEQDSALLKTVHGRDNPGVQLLSAAPFQTDPRSPPRLQPAALAADGAPLPEAADGHARLANARGEQVLVQRSLMGRATLCAATSPLPDLARCASTPAPP